MTPDRTPGPWSMECGDHTHRYVRVYDSDDRTIFYKYGSGTKAEADQDEANARLISAAPELLDALKRNRAALDLIDSARPLQFATTMDLMRKDMDAVILKATGGAS